MNDGVTNIVTDIGRWDNSVRWRDQIKLYYITYCSSRLVRSNIII